MGHMVAFTLAYRHRHLNHGVLKLYNC